MKQNYQIELETAARQMIRIHKVDTLIKLILRTIIKNVRVHHAGIFLYDKQKQEFVVRISRGTRGLKIPAGFAKIKPDNPLISYFSDLRYSMFDQELLLYSKIKAFLRSRTARRNKLIRENAQRILDELDLYQARACIPGFYRNHLVGILFLGAKDDHRSLDKDELSFLSILASDVVMALQNAYLIENLNSQLDVNKKLFLSTVSALASVIEAKDKYTRGHTQRVVDYSLRIADKLAEYKMGDSQKFKENLGISALLHDIGKIAVPESVLNKKSRPTDKELEYITSHPIRGVEILTPIKEFEDIMVGVKYHHERYDGKGYPYRLKGKQIPLIAAVIAVADAYDAMTTDRPYRKALSQQEALKEIKRNRGKQFSPKVADIFLKVIKGK